MQSNQQYCFSDKKGNEVYLFTLRNNRGTEITFTNYGAIITSFRVKNETGIVNDIVLGFDKVKDYLAEDYLKQYPWFGCAIGRYANRIKDASFQIDGEKHRLSKNIGDDQLHGGKDGFDKKIWQFIEAGRSPHQSLELKYISEDGEEGFPGKLETVIRFELTDNNELIYEYKATCDKPTAINLTRHDYFNLNNGEGNIGQHKIKINSSKILEQDKNLITTGKIVSINNTPFDLGEFIQIDKGVPVIAEYDTTYINDNKSISLLAEVISADSKLLLQVYSTEPAIHFYNGKWIPEIKGKSGKLYGPFSGFCLETHKHPNAINIPHFPDTILRPGEIYSQKTIYKVISGFEK